MSEPHPANKTPRRDENSIGSPSKLICEEISENWLVILLLFQAIKMRKLQCEWEIHQNNILLVHQSMKVQIITAYHQTLQDIKLI